MANEGMICEAIDEAFVTENMRGTSFNVPRSLIELSLSGDRIAHAITASGSPGRDEAGGTVGSLTEAVMGMTAALMAIHRSLDNIAEAIENKG